MPLGKHSNYSIAIPPKNYTVGIQENFEGLSFKLYPDVGISTEYYLEKHQLSWFDLNTKKKFYAIYKATSIRDGIYLIDYIFEHQSISIVLDLQKQIFTQIIATPTDSKNKHSSIFITTMDISITQGSIDKQHKPHQSRHQQTDELIGSRYLYYGCFNNMYEHTYLDQNSYIRHGILGKYAGFEDINPCLHFKIANQLYLLICTKKDSPYLVLMLLDKKFYCINGKICDFYNNRLNNYPVTPSFSLLNNTKTML